MGVMTMLGFFPQYTGTADMVLNSPEFPLEIIHLANGKTITMNAPGASSASNYYVQNLKIDGVPWNKPWLPAAAFTTGATLGFTVGSTPNKGWGASPSDAPPSYGTGEQPAIRFLSNQQVTVAPGGSTTVKISAQDVTGRPQVVQASVTAPSGVTVSPGRGSFHVPPSGHGSLALTVKAAASTPQTFYSVPIKLTADGTTLPSQTLTVLVAQPGSLLAAFNNAGISNDTAVSAADFDGGGNSYSAQALAGVGITAGNPVTVGGIAYNWPLPAPGYPDNALAAGQRVTVNAPTGTRQLGFLGSATNGPSQGVVTLAYSDGSTAEYWLGLSDWTLNAGTAKPSYGNQIAATLPYRNCAGCTGGRDTTTTYLFSTSVPVDPSKTLAGVTLPSGATQGSLRVLAVGASTTATSGAVVNSLNPTTASAGQQVTITGSGFGASQGSGYVAFTDEGTTWGTPGGAASLTVDSWSDTAITFTVPQPSGANGQSHVFAGTLASATVVNGSGQVSDSGVLEITPTANLADYYDNAGISPDNNQACANYDGDGYSYSADALAGTGITPGATVTGDGLTFTWPNVAACAPDNILAAGQTMLVPGKSGASKLGLLGSSTNGGTSGTITITYTDGTSTTQSYTLNDWAVGPDTNDSAVSTMTYRNSIAGTSQAIGMYVYATTVPIDATKTVASITFPAISDQVGSSTTAMHVFAVSEG
jgi:hypothetical protein